MSKEGEAPRNLLEVSQQRFYDEVVGVAEGWKVLVMDDVATRVISSILTMFDIMDRRVTLVEQLARKRQPFPEMDVIYFITPSESSIKSLCDDFAIGKKPMYGNVHVILTDELGDELLEQMQATPALLAKIKTLKEIHLEYLCVERSVFQFDMTNSLSKLYGAAPDPTFAATIARKLATVCISLNEYPCIRYQGTSRFAVEVAKICNTILDEFSKANSSFWTHGDGEHSDRDRGNLLILDRSYDPLTPLLHEYSYQAMITDLLNIEDGGLVTYEINTGNGTEEKQALLNEADDLWTQHRHNHIAKVIGDLKEKMQDMANSGGGKLQKKSGADMNLSAMAAAVRDLPEYQQTMTKLSTHVAVSQEAMGVFTKLGLMDLTEVEQTVATGFDEAGTEVKGKALLQLVMDTVRNSSVSKDLKIRLLAIYFITVRTTTSEERKQLCQSAQLTGSEQQTLLNFDRIVLPVAPTTAKEAGKSSIFSMFRKNVNKPPPTVEGEYTDTRYSGPLKGILEQLLASELPVDKFPSVGPHPPNAGDGKSVAKSVRKIGTRWKPKAASQYNGGRNILFMLSGLSYSELKVVYESMAHSNKEIVAGGTHIISPSEYIQDVSSLSSNTAKMSVSKKGSVDNA